MSYIFDDNEKKFKNPIHLKLGMKFSMEIRYRVILIFIIDGRRQSVRRKK